MSSAELYQSIRLICIRESIDLSDVVELYVNYVVDPSALTSEKLNVPMKGELLV